MIRSMLNCLLFLLCSCMVTNFLPVVYGEKLQSYGLNDSILEKKDGAFLVNTLNSIINGLKVEIIKDLTHSFKKSVRNTITEENSLQLKQLQSSILEINNDQCSLLTDIQNVQKETKELQKFAKQKSCAKGWFLFMNHCYFLGYGKTWEQAQKACKVDGGNLVKIENEVENWFLKNFLNDSTFASYNMWIGAYRKTVPGAMVWVSDGSIVRDGFEGWAQGQPDNFRSNEGCVCLRRLWMYQWNDSHCSKKHGYICKS